MRTDTRGRGPISTTSGRPRFIRTESTSRSPAISRGGRDFDVETATLNEPRHDLAEEVLEETDVLAWWGHMPHDEVRGGVVEEVYARVLDAMGLIVLHSAHASKIFW